MIAWQLPIIDFWQQRLNGGGNRSVAKGGQLLQHFQQIVSGASMPPCSIVTVFYSSAVSYWLLVVGQSVQRENCCAMTFGGDY